MKNLIAVSLEEIEQGEQQEFIDELNEGMDSDAPDVIVAEKDQQLATEIDQELSENDRVLDTVTALESLLETAARLPEDLSETEQALIRNSINMAVAGTDIEANQLMPSVESITTRAMAMEGISDTIKNAISSVIHSNDKILSKSEQRFTMYETQIDKIKDKIHNLEKEVSSINDTAEDTVKIYLGRHSRGQEGVVTTKEDFFKSFYEDTKALRVLMKEVIGASSVIDGMLTKTLKSFKSKETYYENMDVCYKDVRDKFLEKVSKSAVFTKQSGNSDATIYGTRKLLGMEQFMVSVPTVKAVKGLDSRSVSKAITNLDFKLVIDKSQDGPWQREKLVFAQFKKSEITKFIGDVKTTLDELQRFTISEARNIKNRRNLARNLAKGYNMFFTTFIFTHAGATGGRIAGRIAGAATGNPVLTAAGAAAGNLAGAVVGANTGKFVSQQVHARLVDLGFDAGGSIMSLISNSLRLQNRITKLYNVATNGVADAMTGHINLGWGVMSKAINTFNIK